ncbi:MAG: PAS domain S-box protein, partial [Leptolyngbya sp. RL_3_1]|nr:PAS domain S-box protein [Leptolyngbya sp. RL_3_1]
MGLFEPGGEVLAVNRTALMFGGLELEDVLGQRIWEAPWFQQLPKAQRLLQQAYEAAAQGEFSRLETQVMGQGGIVLDIDVAIKPIFGEDGSVYQILGDGRDISDRQRTEEALKKSEQRFRAAFEQASIGMVQSDLSGRFVKVNPAFCQFLGYTEAELLETTFQEITYAPDLAISIERIEQLLAGETPLYSLEKRYVRKDGQPYWVSKTLSLVRDDAGAPQYFFCIVEDIHDRKQAELLNQQYAEELATWRDRYDTAGRASGQIVYEWDATANYATWGANIEAVLGYAIEEFPTTMESWLALIHPEDRQLFGAALAQLTPEQPQLLATYRFRHQDGTYVWLEDRNIMSFNAQGVKTRAIGFVANISDRKRLETELRQSQAFLQSIYEGTAVGIGVLAVLGEDQYQYLDTNPAMARIAGVPDDFLKDKAIADLQPFLAPEVYGQILQRYRHCVTTGESLQFEEKTIRAGQETWWLTEVNPLTDENGQVNQLIISTISISDRKRAEQALQHLNAELEQRIQERTQALLGSQTELKIKEAQYRSIFETVGEGIFINDLETGELVEVNPTACQMYGYTYETFLRVSPENYIHPDFHGVFKQFTEALNSGQSFVAQTKGVRQDGSLFDTDVSGRRIFFKGKYHALSTVRDITDRKAAERALKESVSRLRAVVRALPDQLILLRQDGTRLDLFPENSTELSPQKPLPTASPSLVQQDIAQVLTTGTMQLQERRSHRPEGLIYEEIRTVPVDEEIVLRVIRDISESARLEAERKAAERERQKLISLIENSSDFIGISLLETGYPLFLNAAGLQLVG